MEDKKQIVAMDFGQMSDFGLIYLINKQVLHPLGLSLTYDPKTGKSYGVIIAHDLTWSYTTKTHNECRAKLDKFLKHREGTLCQLLSEIKEEI